MISLADRFTDNQISKLQKIGVNSLYDFITIMPLGFYQILPMQQFSFGQERTKYITNAILRKIEIRKKNRRYLVLHFEGQTSFQCYLFSVAKFTLTTLKEGQRYQLLLAHKNNFWVLEKYAALKNQINNDGALVLGSSQLGSYIDTYYSKFGVLHGNYFKTLHKRLKPEDYLLNLSGLVPDNEVISNHINLFNVHHPESLNTYKKTKNEWISFQLFLKIVLKYYVNERRAEKFAKPTTINSNYLDYLFGKLSFELSKTQKETIFGILEEMS